MYREAAKLRAIAVVVLAVGIAAALIIVTVSILYDAKRSTGLSNNATQVLLSVFSGIIGVLGAYVGFKAGSRNGANASSVPTKPWPGESEAETKEIKRS